MADKATCPVHPYAEVQNIPGLGAICPECSDEKVKERRAIEEREAAAKEQDFLNKRLHNAMLSPRFHDKTLFNYEATTEGQKKALETARWFLKNWRDSSGLLLIGKPGTGKNHIASGIVRQFIVSVKGATALCTEPIKIIRAIKETWHISGKSESDVLKSYLLPTLLVIDEVGVQFKSNTEQLYLTEIINDRYNALKPTILCGNMTVPELSELLGDRVIDRFRDNGRVIVFDWDSYRKAR